MGEEVLTEKEWLAKYVSEVGAIHFTQNERLMIMYAMRGHYKSQWNETCGSIMKKLGIKFWKLMG